MKIALPQRVQALLESKLPSDATAAWHSDGASAVAAVAWAEVAWLDLHSPDIAQAVAAGKQLRWVSTLLAGVTAFPLALMRERGILLTNGAGIHKVPVAEFAVMGMLAAAKNLPALVHSQDRREWLKDAAGKVELFESRALVIGFGQIGRAIAVRLRAFGVKVMGVRRRPHADEADVLGPEAWRARLGEFDWIILAAALTNETRQLLGATELRQMKRGAWIVNIARGGLIDQPALLAAARDGTIGGAFLDVTDPEPALPGDPIWSTPNVIVTSHTSGPAQTRLLERASALFLDNLARYRKSEPLRNTVDLELGY